MVLFDNIKEVALNNPDKPAIVDMNGERTTTYSEFWTLINKIAGKIKSLGIKKGEAVIIKMSRRMEYVATELGIIKAGCIAIPVLPQYPQDRIDYIAEISEAKHLITESFFMDIDNYSDEEETELNDDDRALYIFTSGSTGKPKGIVYTVGVIDFPIRTKNSSSGMISNVQFSAMAPMSFVATLGEYFNVLGNGGCSHVISDEVRKDIKKIEEYNEKHQISVGFLPPRMLKVYENKDPNLKILNTGSERVCNLYSDEYKIINNYGQTETCGSVCSFVIDRDYDVAPIGKPKKGINIYLLDENGNEVPDGDEGEICAEGVFPYEYLKMPEATAKTFKRLENGRVLVHTGDIGRKLPDGNYIYVNRKDWMVKINGQRVDPGEIEGALRCVEGVDNAVVKDFTYANGQIYLCGYYVSEKDFTEDELKNALKESLPDYMIPTYFIKLEAIPTNVNGKLDRSQLMPPDLSVYREPYVAPTNDTEKLICDTFMKVLRCDEVGINDNFFLLGGDSIKVMQLQNELDIPGLSTNIIIKGKTPKEIALSINKAGFDLVSDAIKDNRESYPLTPSQMGIYFACVQNPDGTMYNNPMSFEIPKSSAIDIDKLELAVKTAIENHGAINVRIANDDGNPYMKTVKTEITVERISSSEAELENAKLSFVKPFDIFNDVLFRTAIIETEEKYVLAIDVHHLVFDGTSASIIFNEISLAYDGKELEKETLSMQKLGVYEELIEKSEDYENAKGFFESVFGKVEDKAEIINDFEEDINLENKPSNTIYMSVDGALSTANVEKSCSMLGITPNILFLGAFRYTLAKFTGQNDVVICAANHGRHDSRMRNTVGMMVRTIPLYVDINEDNAIVDYLRAVQDNLQSTIDNDIYPFVKLSSEFDIAPDIMFAFQSDAFNSLTLGEEKLPIVAIPVNSALSKLEIMVFKNADKYEIRIKYRSDIYDEAIMKSLSDMYVKVISEFLIKEKLCETAFTNEAQLSLLDSFNNTEKDFDKNKSVVDLFNEQVSKTPDNTALVFLDKKFTYKELDEISDRIAGYVKSKGIGKEDVVSIIVPRCEYMTIASLGVLKAGSAYQPLDPTYPPERLSFMVKDASAKLLIADESLLGLISGYEGDVLLTKDISSLPQCEKLIETPNPEDLFILLYTSGSTGTPKGCMLEHRNLVAFCDYYTSLVGITSESNVAAYASYGFDANMMDMYPTLTSGATLHIIDENIRLDLVAMNHYFEENNIDISFMTTQVGRAFAMSMENSKLKALSTGGEALVPCEPPKGYTFRNIYGPTETTVFVTQKIVDKLYRKIPIGKAANNVKLYILDKYGRRLPVGASGELCISGYQVSRGYLNRPEQTEKVFTRNPFSYDIGYNRMYHSGDIVRYLPTGEVDFVGRRDGQVKIRGFRIELTEVEKIIRDFEGIKDVAVVAFDEVGGGKYVAAYIVADEKIDINALNDFIKENKPPYMVPGATMQIDKIPLNVNGKVDKRKLPKIEPQVEEEEEVISNAPLSFIGQRISSLVAEIIGHEPKNPGKNLLQEGLTSLSIIRLAVSLNKEFGLEANVKELMKGCSILSIENDVQKYMLELLMNPNKNTDNKAEKKDRYPLSKAQFGVYSECMRNQTSISYNIPICYKFDSSVSANELASAVKKVLSAHPILFTHLTLDGNDVEQVYESNPQPNVAIVEMSEDELAELKKEFVQPFNLMSGPLYRVKIVKTESAVYLLSDFHHIAFDGGSTDVFLKQLKTTLEGGNITPEKYDYFDYVVDEKNALEGTEFEKCESFIKEMLADCESASEITPDLKGAIEDGSLAIEAVETDHNQIEKFAKENGLTPAHIYLSATAYVVSRFTNSRNVYLSTISNGRSNLKLAEAFGMFVKTIPVGVSVDDITVKEFINKTKDYYMGSIDNELYPYSMVCRKYNYAPDIMYEYQLGVIEKPIIRGKEVELSAFEFESKAKFKVAVHIEMNNGVPSVVVQYNDALYSQSLMNTFAKSISNVAKALVENPAQSIRKISMLDKESLEKITKMSCTKREEPENKLYHELFEKQVMLTPDKIALYAVDGDFTYKELDERANRVANALIAKGVGVGSRVVILLERTSKYFAALFGILKAGAAYIPTCPDYPKDRIDSIIEDSSADYVITYDEFLDIYSPSINIDELESCENSQKPQVDVTPEDLAYLIYTSGSTGKPKGVMLKHKGIANYLTDNEYNPQVHIVKENCKCYGSVTTVSFDMNLKETACALCNGLSLAFATDEMAMNPISLAEFFIEHNVDVFNATPSRLLVYMEEPKFVEAMANCKVILSGGEKYTYKLLNVLREKTSARIINTYGPTEITVSSNAAELTTASEITVGKPLYNYVEYVVDMDDNKLPPLVVGELIIGGCGVAKGYNNLPEQTEKAFITYDGEAFYRSGDYARWTENGDIAILGRKDNQVKLRGLRIELDEIIKQITNVEGIKSAIAIIRKLGKQDAICAYYTADREMDTQFIKDEISKHLTDYMIPSSFTQLDEMPLTPNGKINIKALAEPVEAERTAGRVAKTVNEKQFCDIFEEVLEIDEVYADDNFFELGGTSLTVTRVVIAAGRVGINIAYGDVFDNPTPAKLAKLTDDSAIEDDSEELGNYNYYGINKVLKKNNLDSFLDGEKQELGNVLVTGAVGFLGIHILYELLHNHDCKVYCMLRSKGKKTAKARLNGMFFYYFDEIIDDNFADRVVVLEGDVTDKNSFSKFMEYDFDTVINCAANVKHFSKGTDIEDVNYYGVLNIIDFCKEKGCRLVHVSTTSVGGMFVGEPGPVSYLREDQLYFGQETSSKYTHAKFLAERAILDEVSKGFNAKIMRVGTLSARAKDGEYQINFTTNTFMGRLKSAKLIGKYPYQAIEAPFELSPIDYVAKAILLLATTPKDCTVFHPFNNHSLMMGDLYNAMNEIGYKIDATEYDDYTEAMNEAKKDPRIAEVLSSMIAYQNMAHGKKTYNVGKYNKYTMQVLYRLGFRWPTTSTEYMKSFIVALKGYGYFEL